MYDYGARNYDPALGRWMNIDPLAEKFIGASPYVYVADNPLLYKDPDGKDVYRYDTKSGKLILMESNKDDNDQIVKYKYNKKTKEYEKDINKKDGSSKIQVGEIAKGILSDGINFRDENNTVAVNGVNMDGTLQPTTEQVENFITSFSNFIQREISGYGLGAKGETKENNILIWKNGENKFDKAVDVIYNLNANVRLEHINLNTYRGVLNNLRDSKYAKYHFHSHPNGQQHNNSPSRDDLQHDASANIPHYIINENGKHPYGKNSSK